MANLTIDLSSSEAGRTSRVWEKTTSDVANASEGADSARDIGYVRKDSYRANVVSALSEGDTEDWFSVNVQTKGNLRITTRVASDNDPDTNLSTIQQYIKDMKDEGVVIEVYKAAPYGRTERIASSADENDKKMYEAFTSLMEGNYKVEETGTFYIRVLRENGANTKDAKEYVVQAQMGDKYLHDYQTTEAPTKQSESANLEALLEKASSVSAQSVASDLLGDMLTNGYNNIAKWQRGKTEKTLIDLIG